jgi:hypothetical protein
MTPEVVSKVFVTSRDFKLYRHAKSAMGSYRHSITMPK